MLPGLAARVRSLWRGVRREAELDAEMREEFRLHQELRAEDLVRAGLSPAEAARQARLEFGSTERYRDEGRASRGLRRFDQLRISWLDLKLGFRMLVRYPGLTLVGGIAIAFAIAAGASTFEFLTQMVNPALPLPGGHRIVGIRLWHTATSSVELRALHDLARWREEVVSIEDLGAFRALQRNLKMSGEAGEPVQVAEITASAFRVARVPAVLGRTLVAADEDAGAPAVVVIGHDEWQRRFAGDPNVVGRRVWLGSAEATIVGVMPRGFAFPVAHGFWTPLRVSDARDQPGEGPDVHVLGRLAPGATLAQAQAQVSAIGRRMAADHPGTHRHLQPQVMPYAQSIMGLGRVESIAFMSVNVLLVMLLVLVCGNVALLMFARAATREGEIAVRSALGASRSRIVMQLFAEALVLGGAAAVAGLVATRFLLGWWLRVSSIDAGGRLPFWFDDRLAPATVLYALALTLLGAVVAGVVPALKVTGRKVEARLRQASAGGGGLRFGGVWTAVVVSQVAVTVAFPATAFFVRQQVVGVQSLDPGFPAHEYLSFRLEMDGEPAAGPSDTSEADHRSRFRARYEALARRLASDPAVLGVTLAANLPRTVHPHRSIEVENPAGEPQEHRVNAAAVAVNYFEVLRAKPVAGRAFHSGDAGTNRVVVNESFVRRVMENRNPLGRRLRSVTRTRTGESVTVQHGVWQEIVGVVPDLGTIHDDPGDLACLYHPEAPGSVVPTHVAVHLRGAPEAFIQPLRRAAAGIDPGLRLHDVLPLDQVGASMWNEFDFLYRLLVVVCAIALLLSLAGIYAVMSFTVSRRTREIGIRVALGARPRRVVLGVLRRPLTQVGAGVVTGTGLAAALALVVSGVFTVKGAALVVAYAALMVAVCMLACVVPTRRALRVEPTAALRADG